MSSGGAETLCEEMREGVARLCLHGGTKKDLGRFNGVLE